VHHLFAVSEDARCVARSGLGCRMPSGAAGGERWSRRLATQPTAGAVDSLGLTHDGWLGLESLGVVCAGVSVISWRLHGVWHQCGWSCDSVTIKQNEQTGGEHQHWSENKQIRARDSLRQVIQTQNKTKRLHTLGSRSAAAGRLSAITCWAAAAHPRPPPTPLPSPPLLPASTRRQAEPHRQAQGALEARVRGMRSTFAAPPPPRCVLRRLNVALTSSASLHRRGRRRRCRSLAAAHQYHHIAWHHLP
jgi:hypothetical protein